MFPQCVFQKKKYINVFFSRTSKVVIFNDAKNVSMPLLGVKLAICKPPVQCLFRFYGHSEVLLKG